jgi:hypothetical protein
VITYIIRRHGGVNILVRGRLGNPGRQRVVVQHAAAVNEHSSRSDANHGIVVEVGAPV